MPKRHENLVNSGDVSRSAYEKARTQQETADAQANAARQQFEAQLNAARQNYRGVEMSQAFAESFRSQLAQAQKALEDTTVHAPYAGSVTARPVAVGEYVATTNKVATVVRIGTLKLQLQTPEQRAASARVGLGVVARVSAYPGRDFTGKVTAVNPSVDPNSRIFILEARFDNAATELRPGMFATARVLLPGGVDAVFIPRSAVIHDKTTDSYQIYTISNGAAHPARRSHQPGGRRLHPHRFRPDRKRNRSHQQPGRSIRRRPPWSPTHENLGPEYIHRRDARYG